MREIYLKDLSVRVGECVFVPDIDSESRSVLGCEHLVGPAEERREVGAEFVLGTQIPESVTQEPDIRKPPLRIDLKLEVRVVRERDVVGCPGTDVLHDQVDES